MKTLEVPLSVIDCPKTAVPKSLLENVKRVGIISPVVLVEKGNGRYAVLAGRKRINAARELGAEKVPAVVVSPQNREKKILLSLSENLVRESSPLQEAELIAKLKKRGYSYSRIGKMLGISKGQVAKRLALLNLTDKFKRLLKKGLLSSSLAYRIATLSRDEQESFYRWAKKSERSFSLSAFEEWKKQTKSVVEKADRVVKEVLSVINALPVSNGNEKEEEEEPMRVVCVCGEVFRPVVEVEENRAVCVCPSCGRKLTAKLFKEE
jgi:ParB/RepB/Spo0J family partition protein